MLKRMHGLRMMRLWIVVAACLAISIAVYCFCVAPSAQKQQSLKDEWKKLDAKLEASLVTLPGRIKGLESYSVWNDKPLRFHSQENLQLALLHLYSLLPKKAREAIWAGKDVYLDTDSAEKEWRIEGTLAKELHNVTEIPFSGRNGTPIGLSVRLYRWAGRDFATPDKYRLAIEADVNIRLIDGGDSSDSATLVEERIVQRWKSEPDIRQLLDHLKEVHTHTGQITIDDAAPFGLLTAAQLEDFYMRLDKQSVGWRFPEITPSLRFYALLSPESRVMLISKGLKFSGLTAKQQDAVLNIIAQAGRESVRRTKPPWYATNPLTPTVGIYFCGSRIDKPEQNPHPVSVKMSKAEIHSEEYYLKKCGKMFYWAEGHDVQTAWKSAQKWDPNAKKSELVRVRIVKHDLEIKLADGKTVRNSTYIRSLTSYADILRIKKAGNPPK
ncbi:MAG: hypothetical protein NT018_13105 [Armatimonadetes bacterium]|nr:hypothetical protein [Armatimonadota bacterium]